MSLREQIADSPANIEWRSDDGSTLVSVPTSIVDRIAGYVGEAYKSVPRRGAEAGGLLVGGVRIGRVSEIFITGFEPVTCDYLYGPSFILSDASLADFRATMARHPAAEILGYYRSHTRSGFGLESSDRELVARLFPGLAGLILLVKPLSPLNLSGSYFFFQRGNLEMRRVGPEFPFAGKIPGGTPPPAIPEPEPAKPKPQSLELADDPPLVTPRTSPAKAAAPMSASYLDPVVDAPPAEPEVSRRRKSLQWEIVAAGLMIAAALGLLWWQYRGDSGEEVAANTHTVATRVASLGLAVQPGEGGWRITWNPNSPSAHDSSRGALDVQDEDSHERIALNAKQIQAGNATYRPIGDDITFRLELERSDNSVSSETYRVLLKTEETAPARVSPAKKSAMPPPETAVAKPPAKPESKPEGEPGEGYKEPEVVDRVAPEVPEGIRPRITVPQPIDVRVSIDRQGRVTSATPLQKGEGLVNYLGERAVVAAKQWTFTPATQNGKPVTSTRTIHFVFEQ